MPQFDKIIFFNQIFWLAVFFLAFYHLLLRFFLPKISAILKTRIKKYGFNYMLSESSNLEITKIHNNSAKPLTIISRIFHQSLSRNSEMYDVWLNEQQNLISAKKLYLTYLIPFFKKKIGLIFLV